MYDYIEVIIRTVVAFSLLMGTAHLLGKQTIAQMNYHDFIASIMVGAIAGNLAFNTNINMFQIVVSFIIFALILYITTILSLKNREARSIFSGRPTVLIQNGKILEHNMMKIKFPMDSLNQALREKGVFDINEVEYCLMEADGHLSVLKKQPFREVTRKDIGLFSSAKSLFPVELIMNGEIMKENFKQNNLTEEWFRIELQQRQITLSSISYCVRGTNGQLYFDLYEDKIKNPIDQEF